LLVFFDGWILSVLVESSGEVRRKAKVREPRNIRDGKCMRMKEGKR
jgi:hypothetical protein